MANQSALTIGLFQPADQAATRQLILTGLGEHFGVIDSSRNPDLDDITAAYVLPGHYFAVALVGDRLVGSGALVGEPSGAEPTGRLVRMSVDREHRRQGVGKALVEHLIGVARQRGYTRLLVETNHDWHDAIGLYQRCSFSECARDEESVYLAYQID